MKNLRHYSVSGGLLRVVGAALAAVMLTAFAQSAAAETLKAESDAVYEGHELKITFSTARYQNSYIRYKYRTADGTATGSGWHKDYEPTSGYLQWSRLSSNADAVVTVETNQDQVCEHDETVKIILTDLQKHYGSSLGWLDWCSNNRGWPCRFEAVATIKQHERGCTASRFGE